MRDRGNRIYVAWIWGSVGVLVRQQTAERLTGLGALAPNGESGPADYLSVSANKMTLLLFQIPGDGRRCLNRL